MRIMWTISLLCIALALRAVGLPLERSPIVMETSGTASTQAQAYEFAWGTAQEHAVWLGLKDGVVTSTTYEDQGTYWRCIVVSTWRPGDCYYLDIETPCGSPSPTAGRHLYSAYDASFACQVASPVYAGDSRQVCVGWTGTGSVPAAGTACNTGTFSLDEDSRCTWHWETEHHLEVAAGGGGSVSATSSWHRAGSTVSVSAQADPGYAFAGWTGDVSSSANPLLLTMNGSKSIAAQFEAEYTANGTPLPWLIAHGLTNRSWDVEEADDSDGDGMPAGDEYVADTNPTNALSVLRLCKLGLTNDGVTVAWKDGIQARQVLERSSDLVHSGAWHPVYTNEPPTNLESEYVNTPMGNGPHFYRITVERP